MRISDWSSDVCSSDLDIARIDEVYAAEQRRGATIRYFEDVEVGEALTPVAKGPLSMVDLICRHIATGMADGYDIGPLRYGWRARSKIAPFYTPDAWGVPQPQQDRKSTRLNSSN